MHDLQPFVEIKPVRMQGLQPFVETEPVWMQGLQPFVEIKPVWKQGLQPFVEIQPVWKLVPIGGLELLQMFRVHHLQPLCLDGAANRMKIKLQHMYVVVRCDEDFRDGVSTGRGAKATIVGT